jgi:hypothetical protein
VKAEDSQLAFGDAMIVHSARRKNPPLNQPLRYRHAAGRRQARQARL